MRAFAQWLRSVREEAGYSQDRLEAMALKRWPTCGVRQARLTDWELAKSLPTLRRFVIVCRVLDLPPERVAEGRALWDAAQLGDLSQEPPLDEREPLEDQSSQWSEPAP